jgi:hypothetical protein
MPVGHRARPEPEPPKVVRLDMAKVEWTPEAVAHLRAALAADDAQLAGARRRACAVLGHNPETYAVCPATTAELIDQLVDKINGTHEGTNNAP